MKKILILLAIIIFNTNHLYSQYEWQQVNALRVLPIKMKCLDSVNCILLTGSGDIIHSGNGGFNWDVLYNEINGFITPYDIAYPDTNHIIVLYYDYRISDNKEIILVKYNSQGIAWDTIRFDSNDSTVFTYRGREIEMSDTLNGIINIGNSIILTDDGWNTYKIINPDLNNKYLINALSFKNNKKFDCFSNSKFYYFTEDGGKTFNKIDIKYFCDDIFFLTDNIGYIKCSEKLTTAPTTGKEIIFKTIDRGYNWEIILDTIINQYFFGGSQISMLNENEGVFVSSYGVIVSTEDGFKTFKQEFLIPDVAGKAPYMTIAYSGNRPIIGAHLYGIFTRIDTLYNNMSVPVLITPADKSSKLMSNIDFQWKKDKGINKYIFLLSTDENFSEIVRNDTLIENELFINVLNKVSGLNNCGQYYWKVGNLIDKTVKWSEIWTFRTRLEKGVLIYPENNAIEIDYDTDVYWEELNGAERYHLQTASDNHFDNLFFSQDTLTSTLHKLEKLPENKDIYWRVRGYCFDGYGDWSQIWKFKTKVNVSVSDENNFHILYPNPAEDYIEINIGNKVLKPFAENDKVQIFDVLGLEVLSEKIHPMTGSHRMNVTHLPLGVYYIRIGEKVEKFVKM
ncbi:MAG: T9SS type A sorting domain-containing protein [Candidatus Kapabacteria bacterium]|nr:T9SS type A sorting domain-containing protein [Candidatus Kapabacteria bacterium]